MYTYMYVCIGLNVHVYICMLKYYVHVCIDYLPFAIAKSSKKYHICCLLVEFPV